MNRWLSAAVLGALMVQAAEAQVGEPSGVWRTGDDRSQISVYPCGDNYCGSIVKLAEPNDAAGMPVRDLNNPDPKLRNRPLIGLRILRDMKPSEDGAEWQGEIYNPEDGDLYSGSIKLAGEKLEVEGCVAIFLCQSQFWTRER